MFESSHRSSSGTSANRWLIVAGAGLVILAFVARMLLDIGNTKVSDLAGVLKPDSTAAQSVAPAPEPVTAPSVVTPEVAAAVVDTPSPVPPAPAPAPATETPTAPARVVQVRPPVLKVDTTSPRATVTGYAVQIGAFGSEANAVKLRDRASTLGYSASVIPQRRGASELYLVRVQGLSSVEAARQASDSLARSLGVTSVVVPPGR